MIKEVDIVDQLELELKEVVEACERLKKEIGKHIVGQHETVDQLIWSIIAGGHALLEGLPGVGKTMLIHTISKVLDLDFSRVQFTPDLMPTDITGTMMIQPATNGKQEFSFFEGPIFSNIVLADEINRATPKTQSALLEAMQEKTVTVMGEMKVLPAPFFVLATQNPLEMEGTYPLPEAQVDRFMIKIDVGYPNKEEMKEIIKRTTGVHHESISKIADGEWIIRAQNLAKQVLVSEHILDFAVNVVTATRPEEKEAPEMIRNYVSYGSGPRGFQSLIQLAKVRALVNGRYHVSIGDIKHCVKPVLRHRIFMNFEGEAEGIGVDTLLDEAVHSTEESLNRV